MFAINHAATALVIKKMYGTVPIIWLLISVQVMELLWVVLNFMGIERTTTDREVQYVGNIHLFSFDEDADPVETGISIGRIRIADGFTPFGGLDIISTLYRITEILEFATKLAQRGIFGPCVYIMIEMKGIKNRILIMRNRLRLWHDFKPATENDLAKEQICDVELLISESAKIAVEYVLWFFERFQWHDPSLELLTSEQQKFLKKKI